jgi:protoporphyrinogen oxidase
MTKKLTRRDFLRLSALAGGMAFIQACRQAAMPLTAVPSARPAGSLPTQGAPTGTAAQPTGTSAPVDQPDPTRQPEKVDIVIVGAGIAGLTAAYALMDRDIRVLEANAKVGGRTTSGQRGPFRYARGTEYLGEPEGVLRKMVRELGLKAVEIPEPMDALFRAGTIYAGYELETRATIAESSIAAYNRFLTQMQSSLAGYEDVPDYDPAGDQAWMDQESAADWFDELRVGKIFRERYNVAARGLFGANLQEISALCALPEFAYDYEDTSPISSLEDLQSDPDEFETSGAFTFPGGISDVTDAIAQTLGSSLVLNAPVQKITKQADGYLVEYANHKALLTNRVLLAIPAPLALQIGVDVMSTRQRELLAQIEYAPYLTCALFSDSPIFTKAFDMALPDGRFLTDLYDSTWVQRAIDPALRSEKSYIASAYIAGQSYHERSILELSDDQVLERLIADLQDVDPQIGTKITGIDIQRYPHAYPVLVPGAYARMIELHKENARGGILLAGDYMIYPTFEAAAESGQLAAELV